MEPQHLIFCIFDTMAHLHSCCLGFQPLEVVSWVSDFMKHGGTMVCCWSWWQFGHLAQARQSFRTGWWLQIFFIFTPKIGEDEPILTSISFTWVGEKPPTRKTLRNLMLTVQLFLWEWTLGGPFQKPLLRLPSSMLQLWHWKVVRGFFRNFFWMKRFPRFFEGLTGRMCCQGLPTLCVVFCGFYAIFGLPIRACGVVTMLLPWRYRPSRRRGVGCGALSIEIPIFQPH